MDTHRQRLILILEHAKNADIEDDRGGYWQEPVTPRKVTMEISNLRDAQASFESWRDANGLGAGNMTKRSGRVTRANGQFVGRFSYNGRFWNSDGNEVIITGHGKETAPIIHSPPRKVYPLHDDTNENAL